MLQDPLGPGRANKTGDMADDSDSESRISSELEIGNWYAGEPDTPTRTTVLFYARVMGARGPVAGIGPYDNVFALINAARRFRRDLFEMGERLVTYTVWHGFHGSFPHRIQRPLCG